MIFGAKRHQYRHTQQGFAAPPFHQIAAQRRGAYRLSTLRQRIEKMRDSAKGV
ncbi:hypothetical protein [Tateyamaria sp. SN3-11]|uniref:hypothetical protein n=1 Tax=Tateyamaria sp. SN3-11 TaxID=3092147 RepID=UPI0039EA03AE